MTSKILHPKEIETATVRLQCGNKSGTAFSIFIDDDKQLFLTSEHNLPEGETVKIIIGNDEEIEANILERITEHDVAILETKLGSFENITALPLKNLQIPYNENWETYGFPVQRVDSGGRYNGTVSRVNEGKKWDVDLECKQYGNLDDFSGLSGSALVMDGFAVGVIGYDYVGTLGATSVHSISEILAKHNISFATNKQGSIPDSIENDITNTKPNTEVFDKINEVITDQISSCFFLISGSPGSGKTTIVAQLELEDKRHVIIDRFFVKVPENDEYPTQIRATPEFFMKWVEEVCYRALYNTPPHKPNSETTLNDRILSIFQLIQKLSDYYQQQGKTAFLVVDGLDDVNKSNIEDYLSIFTQTLPPNFKVIFSCVSKETLPPAMRLTIKTSNEIIVTPLSIQNTEWFIQEQLNGKQLTNTQINELAQKSEGHPLYLRYLIKYVLETDITSIDDWINSIPTIGGEIENYYNKIWLQIDDQTDEIWLTATLARLRVPIDKNTLPELVPETTKHHFISSFKKIQHLLRDKDLISIYHTSFSDFINEKTKEINDQVHSNIADFVLKNSQTNFGISERVYHLANANEQRKRDAVENCNQTWVDECALNSINPDIVLADIKNIIGLAAELGIAYKVISLLLLSQRVSFRYNTLFEENAFFLVNALLALNKPKEAIRYVVRNKTLITADGDAIYLLQKFYEYGADEEAEILLNTINQTCINIVESGFDTDSFNRYIELKFSAISLSSNTDFESAFQEYLYYKKVVAKTIKAHGNTDDAIRKFKDDVGSYHTGYLIWRFDIPPVTKNDDEGPKLTFDDKSSGYIALCIYRAFDFQNRSPEHKAVSNIEKWIKSLEDLIDNYGTHYSYHLILLNVLLRKSKRVDIIEKIYQQEFPKKEDFDLREENGVDLNSHSINRLTLHTECLGFLDDSGQFPELPKYGLNGNWEGNIKAILQYLCFLTGKTKRYYADNKIDKIKSLESKLNDLLEKLIPNLKHRMNWERSYALPESIFRLIYANLIPLLMEAFPGQIPMFAKQIEQKRHYQLGLYTEGYIDSLFTIAQELTKNPVFRVSAFKVVKVLEGHVLATVENRWERNEYLLRLVELYALLGNEGKAANIFKEMVNTSMGPSWYKESQLGIINTAVSNIIPNDGDLSYLQKFAAHLQNASGEMTFQRYVKQQQEKFVGDLAKIGFLDKAIFYFKYLLFPDYKTVIDNAESGKVDMPHPGYGYVLGARAIEEQSGILNMISNISCNGSLIAWALSELFILGDDRYIGGYTIVQADILNYIEDNEPEKLEFVFKRWARFVVTEVCDEHRYEYIRELFSKLSFSNFKKAQDFLESVGMSSTQPRESKDETKNSPKRREDPLDKLIAAKEEVQKNLEVENKAKARKLIVEALEEVQNQKNGIWSFMYSHKINDIRNLFSETYNNSSDFIRDIKNLIINEPYFEEWVIANQIIGLLRNIDDEQEKQLILSSVLEHIDLMVRTPQSLYDKYDWLGSNTEKVSVEQQEKLLLELLIWFLNHPSLVLKNRTIEVLTWLGTVQPEIIIPALVNELLSDGYKVSKELSASIIHQISSLNGCKLPEILKEVIEKKDDEVLAIEHFMIKNSLLESLLELKRNGVDVLDNLIAKFEQTFVPSNRGDGEIIIEEEYLEPISDYLYELNELGILTRQFAETLLGQIEKLTPMAIEKCQKASGYIDRSFNDNNDISLIPDFDTLLRYALNIAISSCTTFEDKEKVAGILRFYQPTFPENKLGTRIEESVERFENEIKDFFEKNRFDFDKWLINDEVPLNYFSSKHADPGHKTNSNSELTAYLIPLNKYSSQEHSYPWPTFPANNYPHNTNSEDETATPLFIKSGYARNVLGSELVPAVINGSVNELLPDVINDVQSTYWRRGRNWENQMQGEAQKTGYYTTIPKDKIDLIGKNYKLIWQVYSEHKFKYIDFFERKEITR